MPAKSSVYEPLDGGADEEEGESLGSRPNPEGSAGCCSRAFIHWMWPMLKVGRRRKLEETDMYPLMEGEKAEHIAAKFEREWAATAGAKGAPWRRMLRTLWAMEGQMFVGMFMQKLAGDSLRFCTPLALEQVIGWLMDENAPAPWWSSFLPPAYRGLYYVFIMTAATVLQCFCYSLSNLGANRVGTHVRTTITVGVYKKSLTQALCARGETTTGKVVNLIASDATRLMWSIPWLHYLPTGLFQLVVSIAFLWSLLGPSVLMGIGATCVTVPLMAWVVRKNNEYNRKVLMRRDTRVSRVNELITAIKLVKSNAWEPGFTKRVTDSRREELQALFMYYLYMLMSGVLWEGGVPLAAAATFITYAWLGNTVTPTIAFTAMSLFDVMVEPAQDMAWILSQFIVALTSFNRKHHRRPPSPADLVSLALWQVQSHGHGLCTGVGAFLESQDLDENALKRSPVDVMRKRAAITIKRGTFNWGTPPQPDKELPQIKKAIKALDKAFEAGAITEKRHENAKAFILDGTVPGADDSAAFALQDIELTVETGSIVGIVGQVGSGKPPRFPSRRDPPSRGSGGTGRCGQASRRCCT